MAERGQRTDQTQRILLLRSLGGDAGQHLLTSNVLHDDGPECRHLPGPAERPLPEFFINEGSCQKKKNESESRCAFGESAINGEPIGRHQPPSLAVMRSRCTEYNDSMATPMRRILQIEEREKKEV